LNNHNLLKKNIDTLHIASSLHSLYWKGYFHRANYNTSMVHISSYSRDCSSWQKSKWIWFTGLWLLIYRI